jgi:hypothetical protein
MGVDRLRVWFASRWFVDDDAIASVVNRFEPSPVQDNNDFSLPTLCQSMRSWNVLL